MLTHFFRDFYEAPLKFSRSPGRTSGRYIPVSNIESKAILAFRIKRFTAKMLRIFIRLLAKPR